MAAQNKQLARHLGAGRIGVAPRRLRQLVLRIDARVEGFAHLAGAKHRLVLALAHLDTHLLAADRRRGTTRQRLESGTARGVGVRLGVDLAVDPRLVESGDAGDGAGFRVDHRACLDRISAAGPAATAYVLSNP